MVKVAKVAWTGKLNELYLYHHATFDIYHIPSIFETCNVKVFAIRNVNIFATLYSV